MRVLGVDPGLTRCGLGVIDVDSRRQLSFIEVSVATSPAHAPLEQRIGEVATHLDAVIARVKPDALALERVFAQHNVRTVMGTAQISGVVLLAAQRAGLPIVLYTPSEVKAAVTGSGRAPKDQVGFMVTKLLGLAEAPKPADAADALAIAICHAIRGGATQGTQRSTSAQELWARAQKQVHQGARRGGGVKPRSTD